MLFTIKLYRSESLEKFSDKYTFLYIYGIFIFGFNIVEFDNSIIDASFYVHLLVLLLYNCGRIFFLYYHFSLVISYLSV